MPRDKIVADLTIQGTPYWRLKTVMDTWCALWFWPLDKVALLDGSDPVYKTTPLAVAPEPEPIPVDLDPAFPTVWEMDSLFGETPKQLTLAEAAPRKPRPKLAPGDHRAVPLANLDDWLDFVEALLGRQDVARDSLASHFTSLSEMEEYEENLESDFYMNMDPVNRLGTRFPGWTVYRRSRRPRLLPLGTALRVGVRRRRLRYAGRQPAMGAASMGGELCTGRDRPVVRTSGDAERFLRVEAYRRLRIHGTYVNSGNRFFAPPISRTAQFGIHVYSDSKPIKFAHLSWLLDAAELPKSLRFAEIGELPEGWDEGSGVPGVKYQGDWDARPHPARVIRVDLELLAAWRPISGSQSQPVEQTKLLNPVTTNEQDAIAALGRIQQHLGDFNPRISRGYDEAGAKKDGLIRASLHDPADWQEVILKGPQIGVATPFFKQPPETGTKGRPQDLTVLPDDACLDRNTLALPTWRLIAASRTSGGTTATERSIDTRSSTGYSGGRWRHIIRIGVSFLRSTRPARRTSMQSGVSRCRSNRDTVLVAGFYGPLYRWTICCGLQELKLRCGTCTCDANS